MDLVDRQIKRLCDLFERADAVTSLVEMGADALPALIHALTDDNDSARQSAAEALGRIGAPAAAGPLRRALSDPNYLVQFAAAQALERIGLPAVSIICGALDDRDEHVRFAAAEVLGRIGDPSAVPALARALSDPVLHVRLKAAAGLGRTRSEAAVSPLCLAMADPDWYLRQAAAGALGEIRHPAAVGALTQRLIDVSSEVRRAAAEALGRIGDPEPQERLTSLLADPDWRVRHAAAVTLSQLGWCAESPEARGLHAAARRDWEAALAEGEPALPAVFRALEDGSVEIRQAVTEALGRHAAAPWARLVVPVLRSRLKLWGGEGEPRVRAALRRAARHLEAASATTRGLPIPALAFGRLGLPRDALPLPAAQEVDAGS
jgi:HEAT repeat protein